MKRAITIAVVTAIGSATVLAAVRYGYGWYLKRHPDDSNAQTTRAAHAPVASPLLQVNPREMRAVLREAYRLGPDRRFMKAMTEVDHFLSGGERELPATTFKNGGWQVTFRGSAVGTLPEWPDFPHLYALLVDFTRKEQQHASFDPPAGRKSLRIEKNLDQFFPSHVLAALDELNRTWSRDERSRALLRQAAHAFVLLDLQAMDRVEIGEALPAKVLSMLALAETTTEEPLLRDRALLADLLGYSGHAGELAPELPENDSLRSFLLRDDEALRRRAEEPAAAPETRYLWLLRLGQLRKEADWENARKHLFPRQDFELPILKTGLELGQFDTDRDLGRLVPEALLDALHARSPEPAWKQILARLFRVDLGAPSTTDRFEKALAANVGGCRGPFLDAPTCEAYYRGWFYSGLFVQGLHYLDALSSLEASQEFASELGTPQAGVTGVATDFASWYRALVGAKAGKVTGEDLARDLASPSQLTALGHPALERTYQDVRQNFRRTDPERLAAVRRLASAMDSRVPHRRELAELARYDLYDLRLAESLWRSALGASRPSDYEARIRFAGFTGDRAALEEILGSSRAPLDARQSALGNLQDLGLSADEARAWLERLVEAYPDEWSIRSRYNRFLERRKEYESARRVVEDWRKRTDGGEGFDAIFSRVALARSYYYQHRYPEAWEAVEPAVDSYQGTAMSWGVRILHELGREADAESLATRAVDRYPDSSATRSDLAAIYWRQGKYKEAAELLKAHPQALTWDDWDDNFAPAFVRVFKERPLEEAVKAFDALVAQRFDPYDLVEIGGHFTSEKDPAKAFALSSRLKPSATYDIGPQLRAYGDLKRFKGKEEALTWLRAQSSPQYYGSNVMSIYYLGRWDLLWDLTSDLSTQRRDTADFIWFVRALGSVQQGIENDAHREELRAYYDAPVSQDFSPLGRFLIGGMTEDELYEWGKASYKRSAVAYCLGLRARSAGDYEQASDWFRVAVETGIAAVPTGNWAADDLQRWAGKDMSLSRLRAAAKPPAEEPGENTIHR